MMKFNLLKRFFDKNILFYTLMVAAFIACQTPSKKSNNQSQSILLFNGKNLEGWKGDTTIWSVKDSCIIGQTTQENKIKQNTFLIYEDSFSDFELSFQYKIIGGNSGVQYRSKVLDEDLFIVGGYQADMEAGTNYSGILYEEKGRGIIANRGENVTIDNDGIKVIKSFAKNDAIQSIINQDEWNNYRIVAQGNHLQHFINGVKTIDVTDDENGKNASSGKIALQVHTGPDMIVSYKNIKIKY